MHPFSESTLAWRCASIRLTKRFAGDGRRSTASASRSGSGELLVAGRSARSGQVDPAAPPGGPGANRRDGTIHAERRGDDRRCRVGRRSRRRLPAFAFDWPIRFGALRTARVGARRGRRLCPPDPDACILLDEPLADASRDPSAPGGAREALRALPGALGAAVVCAMHARRRGRRPVRWRIAIAVLHEGRLRQCGTPAEVVDAPADEVVAAILRPAPHQPRARDSREGRAGAPAGQPDRARWRAASRRSSAATSRSAFVPHHVRLTRDGVGLRGRVRSIEPCEGAALVRVDVEGVSDPRPGSERGGAMASERDPVRVRVDPRRYVVFDDRGVRLDQR